MTWNHHHRRAEVLREVIHTADARRDGLLPMDVDGVAETFGDELTLLGSLHLRWHTRLSGRIEHELADEPLDLEAAVVAGWQSAAADLPGIRMILDHYLAAPTTDEMRSIMSRAVGKEHAMLALMAGRGSAVDLPSARVGEAIEERARTTVPTPRSAARRAAPSLVGRLKAALAA